MVLRFVLYRLPAAAWLLAGIFLLVPPCAAEPAGLTPGFEHPNALWLVVEDEGHTLTLLDAAAMVRVHQASSAAPLRGTIETSDDGRFAYLLAGAGTIVKYQLPQLVAVAQTDVGAVRTFGLSADGRWLLAAMSDPDSLVLLDAHLAPVRSYPVATLDGAATGRVSTILRNAPRKSFVVAIDGFPELWEISWDPQAEAIFDGLVHDYRMGEGVASSGFLGIRRTPLDAMMTDALLSMDGTSVVGTTEPGAARPSRTEVINLNIRRRIATLAIEPGSAAAAVHGNGREYLATVDAAGAVVFQDLRTGQVAHTVRLPSPVAALQATQSPPALWLLSGASPAGPFDLDRIDLSKPQSPRTVLAGIEGPASMQAASDEGGLMLVSGGEPANLRYLTSGAARQAGPMAVRGLRGLRSLGVQIEWPSSAAR